MQAWVKRNAIDLFGFLKFLSYLAALILGVMVLIFNVLAAGDKNIAWGFFMGALAIIGTLPGIMILGNWAPATQEQKKADHWAELYLVGVVVLASLLNAAAYWIF